MSNLSDSEFLLNHSALINLEGDHRSMLLLGPATYRGPVVEVSRWGQLFNYFFATFSSRRVHQDREKIVSRHHNVEVWFVEVDRISNWLQLPDSWKLLQTNCAGREASLKQSSKRGGEFEAVSSLEVCFVCCTHVQIRKFLSWWNSFQAFFCSSTFLCSSREGRGMGSNE